MAKSANWKRTWNFHTKVVIHLKDLEYTINELWENELSKLTNY